MIDIENFQVALHAIFNLSSITGIGFGVFVGQILGAIPGLTATIAISMLIPLTFYMDVSFAIPFLLGMLKGAYFGGSIPAILINTPGTPAAAATCIDGYPLCQQGKGYKALKIALYSSVFGDTFSDVILILFTSLIASVALAFGPPEYTILILFAMILVGGIGSESTSKGITMGALGFFLSCIGMDPMIGVSRFTFGITNLMDGLHMIPVLVGFLCLSEIFTQMNKPISSMLFHAIPVIKSIKDKEFSFKEFKSYIPTIIRSSAIGTGIGALPGLGGPVAAFIAYADVRNRSNPDEKKTFGKGNLKGVAVAESANSAVAGANMIPLLALGIPGDITTAVLLGVFLIHGVIPGPLLFRTNLDIIYKIYLGLMLGNIFNLVIGFYLIRVAYRLISIPRKWLYPMVVVTAIGGIYGLNLNTFDIKVVILFGIFGFFLRKINYPLIPLVIGFILGPLMEANLRRSLLMIRASGSDFLVDRPLLIGLSIVLVYTLFKLLSIKKVFVGRDTKKNGD